MMARVKQALVRVAGPSIRRVAHRIAPLTDRLTRVGTAPARGWLGPEWAEWPPAVDMEAIGDLLPGGTHATLYTRALHQRARRMAIVQRMGTRHRYATLNPKEAGYRFVAALDIQHPEVLGRVERPEDIAWDELPDRILLKPNLGSTNRGVFGLDRIVDDVYVDRLSGLEVTSGDVVARYDDLIAAGKVGTPILVEELLRKPSDPAAIPDDFKVYVFYDHAPLIMQRDMRQGSGPGGGSASGTARSRTWAR